MACARLAARVACSNDLNAPSTLLVALATGMRPISTATKKAKVPSLPTSTSTSSPLSAKADDAVAGGVLRTRRRVERPANW